MLRSFADVVRRLNATTDYERQASRYTRTAYDLRRMTRLLEAVGNPDRAFRSLHIAGTKGKGSCAHFAEAVLRAHGHRTGLYTSPHLVHMRERIRLDGRPVPEPEMVWAFRRLERALDRLKPTYFETMTAAAFLLFARRRVDWAVVEVGLGGRLDATNVIRPAACAITTIDYDHMDKLGTTLAAIAGEKAGIVKDGVPLVSSAQRPAAARAIARRARPFVPSVRVLPSPPDRVKFRTRGPSGRVYEAGLRTVGRHQAANAATALALLDAAGVALSPPKVRRGLSTAVVPGRIEAVGRRPWVVVDAAHNPVAARALARALRRWPSRRKMLLVFGASADKDVKGMLSILEPLADLVILTRAAGARGADPASLAAHLQGPSVVTSSVREAVALARTLAEPRDAVVVTGSFYVAGEALAALGREGA
ncbi:MAG TPA: folylpolyglutamate synthase/dihydrofolate synthase family protein [Planctomycetota bacterium]|nr:folylpolyglutamate synthase/dihydrofolate synthase family protein [Planctomycetota bacterium]